MFCLTKRTHTESEFLVLQQRRQVGTGRQRQPDVFMLGKVQKIFNES